MNEKSLLIKDKQYIYALLRDMKKILDANFF